MLVFGYTNANSMTEKKLIQFSLVTPEKTVYCATAEEVILPVEGGSVAILANHMPYIATLTSGPLVVKKDGTEECLAVFGGCLEFNKNKLVVLTDEVARSEEIDLELAEVAKKRAEEAMQQKDVGEEEYARVAAALERELAKIRVVRRRAR